MSAPVGWTVIKPEPDSVPAGPSSDDLMAIADAVREVAHVALPSEQDVSTSPSESSVGRRGHLRAVPS